MAKREDSDDDDWYNKDDETLLKEVALQMEQVKRNIEETTEYIGAGVPYDEKFLQEWRLNATKQTQDNSPKILTSELRKLAEAGNALDAFLFVFTAEEPDFFSQQICINDSTDRVIIYVRLLAMVAELKVPAFHVILIKHFSQNEQLWDQLCLITTKIFTKRCKSLWKTDQDKIRLDRFVSDVRLLLLQAHIHDTLTPKSLAAFKHFKRLLETSDFKEVINRKVVQEFAANLEKISTEEEVDGAAAAVVLKKQTCEIYPSLSELLECTAEIDNVDTSSSEINLEFADQAILDNSDTMSSELCEFDADAVVDNAGSSTASHVYKSVDEYLNKQKSALRHDIVLSLAYCIKDLKTTQQLSPALAAQVLLYEGVEIMLNENFITAKRHEMLFVNTVPINGKRELHTQLKSELRSLKTGSLICLTTSYNFDDLILALVTHQDPEFSKRGYLAIEIVRQYNIGNVYHKKFTMFSCPAFFEPYNNVFNYLDTCSIDDFPMQDIVVFGKQETPPPAYITAKTVFTANKCKFKPLQEVPTSDLPLNESQRKTLQKVLSNKFALVQGPPGTGKTHLSVQLVKLLLQNETPKPIVVVAYTNDSLDKFLFRISEYTSSIGRLGGQACAKEISQFVVHGRITSDHMVNWRLNRLYSAVNADYKASFEKLQRKEKEFDGTDEGYEQIVKAQNIVRGYAEQLNTLRLFFQYYVVRDRSIVALTTTCAAKMNFLFRLLGCKIVILEEAAEIVESHVLACLTPQTEHVIMIGDHNQLKPFKLLHQHKRSDDLSGSLFERLITRGIVSPAVLVTQYRMRPVIAELMCPTFYDALYNDASVENYEPVKMMLQSLYFKDHKASEKKSEHKSFCNPHEVAEILNLAQYLVIQAKYETEDIVILSPYTQQCNMFRQNLPEHLKSMRVMTVDSFQGLEANIVLLSLVRSNRENQFGFLAEKNRICVALSRAKYGLYIMGNLNVLCFNRIFRQIAAKLKSHNLVGKSFPYAKEVENKINACNLKRI